MAVGPSNGIAELSRDGRRGDDVTAAASFGSSSSTEAGCEPSAGGWAEWMGHPEEDAADTDDSDKEEGSAPCTVSDTPHFIDICRPGTVLENGQLLLPPCAPHRDSWLACERRAQATLPPCHNTNHQIPTSSHVFYPIYAAELDVHSGALDVLSSEI